MGMTQERTG